MTKKTTKSKVRYVDCPPGPGLYRFLEETPEGRRVAKKIGYKPRRK